MKEGYKSIEDIIKEVAKDEGVAVKEVADIWNHQQSYVKKQMDSDDVYAIFLPFIGTLSLNVKQYSKEIRGRIKGLYKTIVKKVTKLKEHENYTEFSNAHKKITGVNKLTRKIIKNFDTGVESTRGVMLHKKCWDIITKYSNGVYSKKENK